MFLLLFLLSSLCRSKRIHGKYGKQHGRAHNYAGSGWSGYQPAYDTGGRGRDRNVGRSSLLYHSVPGTYCMDGTTAGYYYAPSVNNSDYWMVYIEGGGACWTKENCAERAASRLGSSKYFAERMKGQAETTQEKSTNPYFWFFNMIFVPYCTSDLHIGTVTTPTPTTLGYYFSGRNNLDVLMDTWKQNYKINDAIRILVTGLSAGGAATIGNVDHIADTFSNSIVKGIPMAGFFFPGDSDTRESPLFPLSDYPNFMKGTIGGPYHDDSIRSIWKSCVQPGCDEAIEKTGIKVHLCNNAGTHYPYIRTPLFILQNQYDNNQIFNQLQCPENITHAVMSYQYYYGDSFRPSIQQVYAKKGDGLWCPGIESHAGGLTIADRSKAIPINGQYAMDLAGPWFFDDPTEGPKVFEDCDPLSFACSSFGSHTTPQCAVALFDACRSATTVSECNSCVQTNKRQIESKCNSLTMDSFCNEVYPGYINSRLDIPSRANHFEY